ncbi:hypothetical protein B4102_0917 [Heyndrickxia sporothermodurans]|uniref:Uncharacterized protein n=1 Tax=Heyndrickxia sporothermodurans TaxID=46224 RepID=A0A150KQ35_9BACI|nr:hypothetical protein B4102_0917 [Heyndrickxia sporothermodurans]
MQIDIMDERLKMYRQMSDIYRFSAWTVKNVEEKVNANRYYG